MPLKIESGSYEVNRRRSNNNNNNNDTATTPTTSAKRLSKFTLWRHWRRSVHEERGSSEERHRTSGGGGVGGGSNIVVVGPTANNIISGSDNSAGLGRREVAGLLNRADSPGASLPRTSRRSRPHSLAVQPLNYQRLDPEQQQQQQPTPTTTTTTTKVQQQQRPPSAPSANCRRQNEFATGRPAAAGVKQASMTSQESIGSCSLDVERSASDRSDLNAGSLSEKTLHSLALSSTCNGGIESHDNNQHQYPEITEPTSLLSNGHENSKIIIVNEDQSTKETDVDNNEFDEQLTGASLVSSKKPSYLGLACSINGYSGITRYDSKLREGFRSRDSSPGARLIVRDTSPAGLRPNESQSLQAHTNPSPKSQSISPLAMDRQRNGLANGVKDNNRCPIYLDSRTSSPYGAANEGYSEVDRAVGSILSPIRSSSPEHKLSPVAARIASYNQHNKSGSTGLAASSPKSLNVSRTSQSETSPKRNGTIAGASISSSSDLDYLNSSGDSEKSFIQQRVERLYGPGALAQGFYKRSNAVAAAAAAAAANRKSGGGGGGSTDSTLPIVVDVENEDNNNHNEDQEAPLSLPVLRHLRPEFRAQLPVVSPRRPTDGTEQAIKPLKRMTISPQKRTSIDDDNDDAKETKNDNAIKEKSDEAVTESIMTASATSITDQQPAAPEVVLPILEPNVNVANIANQKAAEGLPKSDDQEKDGHYYINILNKEKNRLLALSQAAENELARSEELGLPEEATGRLRSAIGKTGLLATQRMKQFEGLCQMNINKVPGDKFPTTNQDLAGFWDMIMLQVIQVNGMFEAIEELRKSHWQEIPNKSATSQPSSTPSTPQNGNAVKRRQTPSSKSKTSANAEANRKAREAREQTRRQLIEERRQAMRANAKKSADNAIEIYVPET